MTRENPFSHKRAPKMAVRQTKKTKMARWGWKKFLCAQNDAEMCVEKLFFTPNTLYSSYINIVAFFLLFFFSATELISTKFNRVVYQKCIFSLGDQ